MYLTKDKQIKPFKGEVEFENGDKYSGNFKNGKFDGIGIYNHNNSLLIYEGQWKNGVFIKGKKRTSKYIYNGEFKNDLFNGYGHIEYFEHNYFKSYKGEFKEGKCNGRGTIIYNDGYYIGNFKKGKMNGFGLRNFYIKGFVFEGEWKNDKRHGNGKITYNNGQIVLGNWRNDIIDDNVKIITKNKCYSGKLSNNLKDKIIANILYNNGDRYWGETISTIPNGVGTMNYNDGSIFKGIFKDGIKLEGELTYKKITLKTRFENQRNNRTYLNHTTYFKNINKDTNKDINKNTNKKRKRNINYLNVLSDIAIKISKQ